MARWVRGLLPVLVVVLALGAAGCGEEGAEEDAMLTVYVSGPLRGPEAKQGQAPLRRGLGSGADRTRR